MKTMSDRKSQVTIDRVQGTNRVVWPWRTGFRWLRFCFVAITVLTLASANPVTAAETFKSFKLRTLDGAARTLEDFKSKVTLVAFFFPSCIYCNKAFPEMVKVYDKYKVQGLTMVWINIVEEEEEQIQDWLAAHQYTVPVLVGASQQYLMRRYKVRMTPEHFLLNAEGEILYKQRGYEAGYAEELEEKVKQGLRKL